MWVRIAEVARVATLQLQLAGYREVEGSLSKQAVRCQQGMLRVLAKLDRRGAWRGRWLLRRKAYSYVYHCCAQLYGAAGWYPTALTGSLKSLLWYPLPFASTELSAVGERPRRMIVNLLRWIGLQSPDHPRTAALPPGELDAIQLLAQN